MNGWALEGRLVLLDIDLTANVCINKSVIGDEIDNFIWTLTKRCGFAEEGHFRNLLDINCGTVPGGEALIVKGSRFNHEKWPFMAALVHQLGDRRKFICGGTIISAKNVLTAAHCIHSKHKKEKFPIDKLAVLLGHHNLTNFVENGALEVKVARAEIHPDWSLTTQKYDADLAVLELFHDAVFTTLIQPVCLTSDPEALKIDRGFVVSNFDFPKACV